MKKKYLILIVFTSLTIISCKHRIERPVTNYEYFDNTESDTLDKSFLYAITNEEYLQYGSSVAYVNMESDTIIPFGQYAYFGTDSFIYYANVMEHPNDSTFGRQIGINREQKILFDIVMFDYGPDPFQENLTRVLRNGKFGFANKYGIVVIPCIYDYAKWFVNGKAEVTFDAVEYLDMEEHMRVESDEWFEIDKQGKTIKNAP